jgi:PadR family transcriptional regulator PadR
MSSEDSLGAFEEQVMLAVLHARDDAYGMNVRREIEGRAGREVAIGAVYATLDRLEAKGLVASSRGPGDGGSRRVFAVTLAGTRALVETRTVRDRLWVGLDPRLLANR